MPVKPKFKVGDKVKCIVPYTTSGYGWSEGQVLTVQRLIGTANFASQEQPSYTQKVSEFELIARTKEELTKELEKAQAEVESITNKLKWMEETGAEIYDENEEKVYSTLQVLKTKKSDVEKAKIIAKLINS